MKTNIAITMPKIEVQKADAVIDVTIDEKKFGELRISQGSIDFYPKGSKTRHYRSTWTELCDLLKNNGVLRS